MTNTSRGHRRLTTGARSVAVAGSVVALAAAAACGSSGGTTKTAKNTTKNAASSQADTAKACKSWLAVDKVSDQGPGGGQGEPSAADIRAFAGHLKPPVAQFVAVAPAQPKAHAQQALSVVTGVLKGGNPAKLDTEHNPALQADVNGIEKWVHGSCGFHQLDVTGVDYAFEHLPKQVDGGTVSIKFVNKSMHQEDHELVLLRIKPGAKFSAEKLAEALKVNPGEAEKKYGAQVQPVGETNAPAGQTSYTTATLPAGDYVAACFVGNPPHTMKGMVQALKVS